MTMTTEGFGGLHRRPGVIRRPCGVLAWVLAWPLRVYAARQLMLQLGGLGDRELRDIGLTRSDLADMSALPRDADPSTVLRRRVQERRRRQSLSGLRIDSRI